MSKKTVNLNNKVRLTLKGAALSLAIVLATVPSSMQPLSSPQVFADPYDEKISALNNQIEQNQQKAAELEAQGDTLAGRMEQLRLETSNLQAKIDVNQAQNEQLEKQIDEAEVKIEQNKAALVDSIRKSYMDGDLSTLQLLASSKNITDYVNEQEYRDRIKDKITSLTEEVTKQKQDLESKQQQVANLIRDQVNLRVDLQAKHGETSKLLDQTKGQEEAYRNQVSADNAEVARLKREQAAANAAALAPKRGSISYVPSSGVINGGYPSLWQNATQDSLVDTWGMYNRECVSYTAFKVYQSGRYMPYWGGRGNANLWPSNARRAGIPVDNNPRVGDVAISMQGYYGHAMYVERVNGDGTVYVSQYNYGIRGEYSEMTISTSGLYFIHF